MLDQLSQIRKCQAFTELHQQQGAFLIPNPWDIGSAKILEGLGYQALATTSAGLAYTLGRSDGEVTLAEKLTHLEQLASNTNVPINADFENGFCHSPEGVARNIALAIETGIAGCSIEDYNPDTGTIYDFELAVERIQAAVEVVAACGMSFQLTARAENFFRGIHNEDDTLKRLQAYDAAGANVLYAPGIRSHEQLHRFTSELDAPVNVLAPGIPDATVESLSEAGAKRISVGGALNWAAVNPLLLAAKEMQQEGTFTWLQNMPSRSEIHELLLVQRAAL